MTLEPGCKGTPRSAAASRPHSFGWMIARRVLPLVTGGLLSSGLAQAAELKVDDIADPGSAGDRNCALREAIVSVNTSVADPDCKNQSGDPLGTDDTIVFDSDLDGETITLDGSALSIEADVMILGPDPGNPKGITIAADKRSRVLVVAGSDTQATLDALTLQDGVTITDGGAVLVDSGPSNPAALTLVNCIITGSAADDDGGAAHVAEEDSLILHTCALYGNSAGSKGGAVSVSSGALSVYDSEIHSNESDGGTIYASPAGSIPSPIVISGSTIRNNDVPSDNTGGIWAAQGPLDTVSLTDSTVRDNAGRGISSGSGGLELLRSTVSGHVHTGIGFGGAGILASDDTSIVDSTISGNSTEANGGGIFGSNDTSLTLTNSTISGNSAGASGGGIFMNAFTTGAQISGSTISGNTADANVGGIFVGNSAQITNSTISGNTAGIRAGGIGGILDGDVLNLEFSTVAGNESSMAGSNLHIFANGTVNVLASMIVNGQGAANCGGEPLNTVSASLIDESVSATCAALTEDVTARTRLGPLADNGGLTMTHALFEGHPAIEGAGASCPGTDQRGSGFSRPVDGDGNNLATCDIGAVEFIDTDFDGVINHYENNNGLDPNDANAPNGGDDDLDMDGVTNQNEFESGLAANNPDSDGDNLGDAIDNDPANNSNACIQDGMGDAQFDFTAMSGMVTQCAAENSITVLNAATSIIEAGAVVQLYAPNVSFQASAAVPQTAEVEVNAVDPTPGMTP